MGRRDVAGHFEDRARQEQHGRLADVERLPPASGLSAQPDPCDPLRRQAGVVLHPERWPAMIEIPTERRRAYLRTCRLLAVLSTVAAAAYLKWLLFDALPDNHALYWVCLLYTSPSPRD